MFKEPFQLWRNSQGKTIRERGIIADEQWFHIFWDLIMDNAIAIRPTPLTIEKARGFVLTAYNHRILYNFISMDAVCNKPKRRT